MINKLTNRNQLLALIPTVYAQPISGNVKAPSTVPTSPDLLGTILGNAITIAFVIATLVVLFFLVLGAFQWITSGGEKEKVSKARGTIVNALIGLALLALAFLIANVVARILGIPSLTNFCIPTLITSC